MTKRTCARRSGALCGAALAALLWAAPLAAFAQGTAPGAELERRVAAQEALLQQQAALIAAQREELERQRAELLEQRRALAQHARVLEATARATGLVPGGRSPGGEQQPASPQPPPSAAPAPAPVDPIATAPAAESVQSAEAARPQSERAVDQSLVDLGSVLLPAGTLQVDSALQYERVLADRINIAGFSVFDAIVIGTIRVDQIQREISSAAFTARYGLADRLQVDFRVPYVYRRDREVKGFGTGTASERTFDGEGLGDADLTLSWQPISNRGWRPAAILRARARGPSGLSAFDVKREPDKDGRPQIVEAPRGSGFWGYGGGATLVWQQDPAVFFVNAGYMTNEPRTYGPFGKIDPGDTLDLGAGFNLALNERASFNVSVAGQRTFRTRQNGVGLTGSTATDARLVLGGSFGLTDRVSLVLSAQAGLTPESPDFAISASIPITFRGLKLPWS